MFSPACYSSSNDWPTSRTYCRLSASVQASHPANHHTLRISPYNRLSAPDRAQSLELSMVQRTRLCFATEIRLLQSEDSILSIHSFVVRIANVNGSKNWSALVHALLRISLSYQFDKVESFAEGFTSRTGSSTCSGLFTACGNMPRQLRLCLHSRLRTAAHFASKLMSSHVSSCITFPYLQPTIHLFRRAQGV